MVIQEKVTRTDWFDAPFEREAPMTDSSISIPTESRTTTKKSKPRDHSTLMKLTRYTLTRLAILMFTVTIGVYLTILIANMGGYVDEIRMGLIQEEVSIRIFQDQSPEIRQLSPEQKQGLIEAQVAVEVKRLGLDKPFVIRSFVFLKDALTLNLGMADKMLSDSGSRTVRLIMLERLPATLVLFGSANLLLFFFGIFLALFLSRRYGSFLDKAVITLAPTGAAPGWFYGIFLILIFAAILKVLPFGGMVDAPPPEGTFAYGMSLLKHLILPVAAILISAIFLNAYNWRTFFLIYSSEEYVEMAKAKGLPERDIERRYIMRPTLPTIITAFALLLIGLWTGAIILETTFNWPGLGRALFQAIGFYDTPVIVGSTVIFAYLLAITVFLLEFIYALVDPRVRVGN
jgi:peptide/nickel transport system permease protein